MDLKTNEIKSIELVNELPETSIKKQMVLPSGARKRTKTPTTFLSR
jgi:hypothetical protein